MKKRFFLIFLFIFSSVAIASAVSDFAIAAGAIAGATALAAVVGVAVGAPLVVPAVLVVGVALELANYSFFAKNNQASSVVLPKLKEALTPMSAAAQAKYFNQITAESGGSTPVSGSVALGQVGQTDAEACDAAALYYADVLPTWHVVSHAVVGSNCVITTYNLLVQREDIDIAYPISSGSGCPSGTTVDANGLCQVTLDPSAPNYVRLDDGTILPNPANYPNYGSGYTDLSSGNVIEVLAPDGSRVKVDAAASTLGDTYPPVEITITGSSDAGGSSATSTPKLIEHVFSDGSIAESVVIPEFQIVDSQGNPSVVPVVATQIYDNLGASLGAPIVQSPSPALDPGSSIPTGPETTCPPGTTLNTGYCIPDSGNPFTDPGTGTTPGTGSGSCPSGDCSTESTQLANKGLLQSIKDFFTGTSVAPGDPDSKTASDIKSAGLSGSGTFSGLSGWSLPAHASQCPTSSFAWEGRTFMIDAHCQLISDNFGVFRLIMTAVFSLSALFIVLKA